MRKRVYLANTGGTIAMTRTAEGYAPAPGFLARLLAEMPELSHPSMPEVTIHEYDPLLDSANMTPEDWLRIARDIAGRYDEYDGFAVLHGTDTMAYTASALAFMFQGLRKPVVLTGSQIPLSEFRNDARENLIGALLIAADQPIPEVCLYFGHTLLRGCRAVKVHADGFDAFASPRYPPLGTVGIDIGIHWQRVRKPRAAAALAVQPIRTATVGALRLFPGVSATLVEHVLQPPLEGLVLEAYGVGNGPDRDAAFFAALEAAARRGVVIVACTQCLEGTVDLGDYAAGAALARAGVVSGRDMTTEAALAKLFYLFSAGHPPNEVKRLVEADLRGELTPPQPPG